MTNKTEFLNLDEVAAPKRTVTISGKTYQVLDMTVENFIETQQASEKLQGEEVSHAKNISALVAMVHRYIPDIDVAELRKLSFQKLSVLLSFVNGTLGDDEGEADSGGAAEKK
jgi:hypothetical protein